MMSNKLILGSLSPRRQELLKQVNIPFTVRNPNVDESKITSNDPIEKVEQLASLKAKNISLSENEVILSADTVVAYQNNIFEKPQSKEDAYHMISKLSGNIHDVYTGVMLRSLHESKMIVERTEVEFLPLTEEEIHWYISTEEPYDKAGAYGIQSLGASLVRKINGDFYNVVGLPLSRVVRELRYFSIFPNKD